MSANSDCGTCHPIVHLAFASGTACGTRAKRTAYAAAGVTCPACRATWAFAAASRRDRILGLIKEGQ